MTRQDIARALADKFKIRVELEQVKQGAKLPCFFVEYLGSRTNKIAFIEYSRTYSYDVSYYPKGDKLNEELEQIAKQLDELRDITGCEVINTDIDVVDGVLHYFIDVIESVDLVPSEHSNNKTYMLIMEELKKITNLKVYYQNGNLKELKNGFFVLEPSSTTTETISIGGRKEKHRDIVIRYTFIDKQQDVADFLENTLDTLQRQIKGKNGIYNIDYTLDISYEKEEYQEFNIVNYEATLELSERGN